MVEELSWIFIVKIINAQQKNKKEIHTDNSIEKRFILKIFRIVKKMNVGKYNSLIFYKFLYD